MKRQNHDDEEKQVPSEDPNHANLLPSEKVVLPSSDVRLITAYKVPLGVLVYPVFCTKTL
jgi:hypothetical protein